MNLLLRVTLISLYPLLLCARCLNAALGRDPLRLKDPETTSYWIERRSEPDSHSYFSEESVAEGQAHGGMGLIARVPLRLLARIYAPPRSHRPGDEMAPAADREEGIPDEVYTLW